MYLLPGNRYIAQFSEFPVTQHLFAHSGELDVKAESFV